MLHFNNKKPDKNEIKLTQSRKESEKKRIMRNPLIIRKLPIEI